MHDGQQKSDGCLVKGIVLALRFGLVGEFCFGYIFIAVNLEPQLVKWFSNLPLHFASRGKCSARVMKYKGLLPTLLSLYSVNLSFAPLSSVFTAVYWHLQYQGYHKGVTLVPFCLKNFKTCIKESNSLMHVLMRVYRTN